MHQSPMNKKVFAALATVFALAFTIWFVKFRHSGEAKPAQLSAPSGSAASANPKPKTEDPWQKDDRGPERTPQAARWSFDNDPQGTLPLEGQVVGPDGKGVGSAEVWISSVPPQSTVSKDDGSFAFAKLVGRTYELTATAGDLVGTLAFKLTPQSDPAIIKLTQGASIAVTVTDEENHPVRNANVGVVDVSARKASTDGSGKVTLVAVPVGWVSLEASADGYAPTTRFASVAVSKTPIEIAITLKKGVAVSGRVVDEAGKPIKGAHISPKSPGWGGGSGNSSTPIVSDEKGQWKVPALAAGTYTFSAFDGEHAPSESRPTTITTRATDGVEIVMKVGGALRGTVTTTEGSASPYATVRVARAERRGEEWGGALRQSVADEHGVFVIKGLPREKLQVRAESDAAASKVIAADVTTVNEVKDLKIILDVKGTIAGVVVDELGAPVAEASVNATVDFMAGGDISASALSGFSTATTDGAGAFVIRGLPDGDYKVWAQRPGSASQEWGQNGVKAKTGDKTVRVTLAAPGSIVGKIVIEGSNKPPKMAMVSEGWSPAVPTRDGSFELKNLNPGKHDISLRGVEFAEMVKHDINVEPGKVTDMGTITVPLGRKVIGRVVDGKGLPIEGARVKLGLMLVSGGGDQAAEQQMEEQQGVRSANTDANGEFIIQGVPTKPTRAAASHPTLGASLAVDVAAGETDVRGVTLVLKGFGSIAGKVMYQDKPLAASGVSVTPKGGSALLTNTDANGEFVVDKVPEGKQIVTVMRTKMMSVKMFSQEVSVVAGQKTTATIVVLSGPLSVEVQFKPQAGAKVDGVVVALVKGIAGFKTGSDLIKNFFGSSIPGPGGQNVWMGKAFPFPTLDDLDVGSYSICSAPMTADVVDQQFFGRFMENIDSVKVYCKQVTLTATPAKQTFVHELPSMEPWPAPK
jgi:uncharacterized GH25 family protein